MSKLIRAISKDYLRSAVISLISTLIVLPLVCALIFVPLWAFNQADGNIWILIVPAVLLLLILYGGAFGVLGWTFYRRKRWLDGVFTPLGLEGSAYMLSGRQYRGAVGRREVTARFYRGPTLDLSISTPLQTRLGVVEKSRLGAALAGVFQRKPLSLNDPDLDTLNVFALDEGWARSLLTDPKAKELLQRLMRAGESWVLMPQVRLQPGRLLLRLYRNKNLFRYSIEPQEAQEWLGSLIALVRIAEELPPPQVTAEETEAERLVRSGRIFPIALIVVLAVVGIPACLAAAIAIALILIEGR